MISYSTSYIKGFLIAIYPETLYVRPDIPAKPGMERHLPIWVIHGLARLEKRCVLPSNERQHFAGLFASNQARPLCSSTRPKCNLQSIQFECGSGCLIC
jgi:hypothetical protein